MGKSYAEPVHGHLATLPLSSLPPSSGRGSTDSKTTKWASRSEPLEHARELDHESMSRAQNSWNAAAVVTWILKTWVVLLLSQ
jgi:hypothetical protein